MASAWHLVSRPFAVRRCPGSPCGVARSVACASGCPVTAKTMNTIRATTMTAVGAHSDSRWAMVSDSAGHGGLVIPAQLSGTPNTRPTKSQTPQPHFSRALRPPKPASPGLWPPSSRYDGDRSRALQRRAVRVALKAVAATAWFPRFFPSALGADHSGGPGSLHAGLAVPAQARRCGAELHPSGFPAGEGGCQRGTDGADGPVPGYPVDDDRGCRRSRRDAGEGERAEHAAFDAAEAAGQRDEPAGQLPGGVGEQQP